MQALQQQCLAKYEAVMQKAEQHFNSTFSRMPIVFSNKLTKTGGYYQFNRFANRGIKIQLSNSILRLNPEQFVKEVVGHEAAHQIAHELHGLNVNHGREWKHIMNVIGQDAKRCHSMKTETTARGQRFTYKIGFETLQLGPVRHRHIQNGTKKYTVRGCGVLKAEHWAGAQKFPELQTKPILKPRNEQPLPKPMPGASKADKIRAFIKLAKTQGYSLRLTLDSNVMVREAATLAGLKPGLAKTYIKNNWNKV